MSTVDRDRSDADQAPTVGERRTMTSGTWPPTFGGSIADRRLGVARVVLGVDPESQPHRTRSAWESHSGRGAWMTAHGFQHLLRSAG